METEAYDCLAPSHNTVTRSSDETSSTVSVLFRDRDVLHCPGGQFYYM